MSYFSDQVIVTELLCCTSDSISIKCIDDGVRSQLHADILIGWCDRFWSITISCGRDLKNGDVLI